MVVVEEAPPPVIVESAESGPGPDSVPPPQLEAPGKETASESFVVNEGPDDDNDGTDNAFNKVFRVK